MLKISAAALLATLCCAGAANARGGGGVEPMPGTNFTDMPSYSPQTMTPVRLHKTKHRHWQRGLWYGR